MPGRNLLLILSLLLAAGCGGGLGGSQVPEKGQYSLTKPNSGPPDYNFDSSFSDVLEFEQGVAQQYNLIKSAHVPAPGKAAIIIRNLPKDATFDGKNLKWKPSCTPDANFYKRGYGMAYIRVNLKSSLDPDQYIERRVALLVHQFQEFDDFKCGEQ